MGEVTRRTVWDSKTRSEVPSPSPQWEGDWQGTAAMDMTGRPIEPGMWLVKTYQSGRSCNLEIRQVRDVRQTRQDGPRRVFLDDSRVPIEYPGRCLIVDWDPEAERLAHTKELDW